MRTYVMTTGVVFGLLALIHVWRVIEEGFTVANPFFLLITAIAAAFCGWALRLLKTSAPPG